MNRRLCSFVDIYFQGKVTVLFETLHLCAETMVACTNADALDFHATSCEVRYNNWQRNKWSVCKRKLRDAPKVINRYTRVEMHLAMWSRISMRSCVPP